jgi:trans-aconitate methyltransferase
LQEDFAQWNSPWSFPKEEDYEAMMKRTGFVNRNVYVKEYDITFPSVNETIEWWRSAGLRPFLAELNRGEGEYFAYSIAMKFERNRTERGIEFTFRRLFAFGEI